MANMYKSTLESTLTPTGNATSSDVLSGKTFMNASGAQTGSMTNNGAVSGTATPTQPYTIPEGYHNGQGVVSASGSTAKFSIEYYSVSAISIQNYQFISKAFLNANGYTKVKVTATTGNAFLFNNASVGGASPTSIGSVSGGNSQTFNLSLVTANYLQIGANQHSLFEFQ